MNFRKPEGESLEWNVERNFTTRQRAFLGNQCYQCHFTRITDRFSFLVGLIEGPFSVVYPDVLKFSERKSVRKFMFFRFFSFSVFNENDSRNSRAD